MAIKDTSLGLLFKVARFVRHPTKDWSELDLPESEPEPESESGYDKKALKEMIERKRQNDFVRRREFDQLRKLRRTGLLLGAAVAGRPSFFQASTTSNLDERAMTLKKIDEIEAQMSKQWWKGKHDQAVVQDGGFPVAAKPQRPTKDAAPTSVLSDTSANMFTFTATAASNSKSQVGQNFDYLPTQMGCVSPEDMAAVGSARQPRARPSAGGKKLAAGLSEFSTSKLSSVELGNSLADPDLEEAAIRFANGDDKGAEATLLSALQADKVEPASADGWAAALFDFYRATAQQSSFDRVAIDYAQRFGRSAPAWFSTPELVKRPLLADEERLPLTALAGAGAAVWDCPKVLDLPAVQALNASLARLAPGLPWRLNWCRLDTIATDAAKVLAQLFAQWSTQDVRLHFEGADVLDKTLRDCTPSGQKEVPSFWWQLRLDVLRLMRRQDEFELVALDFCVTYEVSPPPWSEPRCDYVNERMNATAPLADGDTLFEDTTQVESDRTAATQVELAGELLGDATPALDTFKTSLQGTERIVISCERLIRVDFSAAGSILNWVAAREAEGCAVQFRDVPRLVAAFFNVIGINEHAQVALRTN